MIHFSFVDTESLVRAQAAAEQALRMQGLPDDQIEAALGIQEAMSGPIVAPLLGSISTMVVGTIIALISSIFTRKKPADTSSA